MVAHCLGSVIAIELPIVHLAFMKLMEDALIVNIVGFDSERCGCSGDATSLDQHLAMARVGFVTKPVTFKPHHTIEDAHLLVKALALSCRPLVFRSKTFASSASYQSNRAREDRAVTSSPWVTTEISRSR